ncbi:hypothetical protein [Clostridium perfringens]|uniref:hypothetical protein n=1 Tax=Clostridium perfringens TaxID=1502 RepID=UPI0008A667E4|nr:hypothetical protein [Clostridium perfringens]AOY53856.1 hypothetical protein FORC25_1441 [Clostridium perfringens]MDK0856950.1 hypothetical protein [Clostridium perfringens]MDM0730215.1 hypothetical protein [Clostridium perfringens]
MALSKMDKKCKNCKHKDNCDNKRMVACSVAEIPQANMISATFTDNMVPCGQPLMRKETPITINMGEFGKIETSLEEISESLKKDFYKELGIGVCLHEEVLK